MEGLGTKVKEVFNESKVMEHMWPEGNFPQTKNGLFLTLSSKPNGLFLALGSATSSARTKKNYFNTNIPLISGELRPQKPLLLLTLLKVLGTYFGRTYIPQDQLSS